MYNQIICSFFVSTPRASEIFTTYIPGWIPGISIFSRLNWVECRISTLPCKSSKAIWRGFSSSNSKKKEARAGFGYKAICCDSGDSTAVSCENWIQLRLYPSLRDNRRIIFLPAVSDTVVDCICQFCQPPVLPNETDFNGTIEPFWSFNTAICAEAAFTEIRKSIA